jgi:hypothetical protein
MSSSRCRRSPNLSAIPDALRRTLIAVAEAMRPARDPWWIIASGAMALHGAPVEVADVDLLTSERDGRALTESLGLSPGCSPGTDRFRSDIFARWDGLPLPVEIMAGFRVRTAEGWHPVRPATRVAKSIGNATLYAPAVAELIAHCALFDRPKDHARAAILQRLE